jgi:hypothetical protein
MSTNYEVPHCIYIFHDFSGNPWRCSVEPQGSWEPWLGKTALGVPLLFQTAMKAAEDVCRVFLCCVSCTGRRIAKGPTFCPDSCTNYLEQSFLIGGPRTPIGPQAVPKGTANWVDSKLLLLLLLLSLHYISALPHCSKWYEERSIPSVFILVSLYYSHSKCMT